jgi:hypothetical protein
MDSENPILVASTSMSCEKSLAIPQKKEYDRSFFTAKQAMQ